MIALFGNIFLILALFFSLTQSIPVFIGYYKHNAYALACARPSAWAQFACNLVAYLLLTTAFVTNDFSIAYVAANSHHQLPLMYRLTAAWGAHEGSILLWIVVLSSWSIAYAITQPRSAFYSLVLAILGIISFCFLCFLILTSNPFLPAETLSAGYDLNPLLQDPGFVMHPPMLYIGYVGFSTAFAITLACLINGKLQPAQARLIRQFAVAAWCFLTLGIALGSWWAYRVLGWGGFWFWDPVENASLLPWLCGTALIHILVLVEKRDTAQSWAALLAIVCFALSLLGTFLVRSGVLISAHTFASDPARGVFLLLLLAIVSMIALIIYIVRLPVIHSSNLKTKSPRDLMLLLNSALLFLSMLIILLGTLYPLIVDALNLGTISVGAPYFNAVMLPMAITIMLSMSIAPFCSWQILHSRFPYTLFFKRLFLSITIACIFLWSTQQTIDFISWLSLSLSLLIILSLYGSWKKLPAMSFSHAGFAIFIIGILLSSLLKQEREIRLQPGDSVTLGPYQFIFVDTKGIQGENYRAIRGEFAVLKKTRHIVNLYPEKRIYTVRGMIMTKVDIHPGIFRDLYIALGEPLNKNAWSIRVYYKPFIRWIWFGALLMMLGGIFAILQRPKEILSKGNKKEN